MVIDYRIDCRIDLSLTETQTSIHNSFTIILNSSLTLVITDLVIVLMLNDNGGVVIDDSEDNEMIKKLWQ